MGESLPPTAYRGEDEVKGEGTVAGWTRSFPHVLACPAARPIGSIYCRWQQVALRRRIPRADGRAAIDALKLGQGKATDFLGVSFSAVDGVGHSFGPRSHEIQDTIVRLDRTIGRLLDHLDATVGRGNYVLGLSADHGVAEIPEQVGGGRVASKAVTEALQKVLVPALGPGHARRVDGLHQRLPDRRGAPPAGEGPRAARSGAGRRARRPGHQLRVLGT